MANANSVKASTPVEPVVPVLMSRDEVTSLVTGPLMAQPQRLALANMYLQQAFNAIDEISKLGSILSLANGAPIPQTFAPKTIEHPMFPGGMVVNDQSSLEKAKQQGWTVKGEGTEERLKALEDKTGITKEKEAEAIAAASAASSSSAAATPVSTSSNAT